MNSLSQGIRPIAMLGGKRVKNKADRYYNDNL